MVAQLLSALSFSTIKFYWALFKMSNGFISRTGYWAEGAQSKGEVLDINLSPFYPLISLKKDEIVGVCFCA